MENQNQQALNQQPEEVKIKPLHERHFKSFWPIVFIAVLSALVGGLLVWAAFNQGLEDEINSLIPGANFKHRAPSVLKERSGERLQAFEIKDWQTYTNKEYGFSFKYPINWEVLDNNAADGGYFDLSLRDKKYKSSMEWPGLRITNLSADAKFLNVKESMVFDMSNAKDDVASVYFRNANKNIYASCAMYIDNSVLDKCNQILSTFKFTN
jgi:hypothetical protein